MNLAEIKAAAEAEPGIATEKWWQEVQRTASDFASIRFENHEARELALAFFRLQRELDAANTRQAWLVERCEELAETLGHIEAVATLEPKQGAHKIVRAARAALARLEGEL